VSRVLRRAALPFLCGLLVAPGARAGGPAGEATPASARTATLYRLDGAILPPDGVLLFGCGGESYGIEYPRPGYEPYEASLRDLRLRLEYGPLPGTRLTFDATRRSWTGPAGLLPASGGGMGDARLGLTLGLPSPRPALAWAATARLTLPTGTREDGTGEGRTVTQAGVAAALRLWRASAYPELRLHLAAVRRWNPDAGRGPGGGDALFLPWPPVYPAVPPDGGGGDNDFLQLAAAVEVRREDISLYFEYSEARLPRAAGAAVGEYPRHFTPGLHWGRADGWGLSVAYDVNLSLDDPATPYLPAAPDLVWHAMLSRGFALGGRDRDDDGVPDRRDGCPTAAEDRDGWRDADGCPDPDNDGDGIEDTVDGAPDVPEDRDGFQDEDGIPDPDNDDDGIADARDVCPDLAEDFDGDRDGDGCPEELRDRDGDGIADERDHCPGAAEDRDGYEDDDGCPDPDNDLDGIDDVRDRCPNEPEDYDGVADDDGCPE
jgi:hypothetical protein